MTQITRDEVLKLAKLAKLKLNEDELKKFREEISEIIQYVEKLQAVNLDEFIPTNQVTGLENVMRDDVKVDYGTTREELLKNVPAVDEGYIKVKRVLE